MNTNDLRNELSSLLNRASRENQSNTADFILSEYMIGCLEAFERATQKRSEWYTGILDANGIKIGRAHV